MIRHVIFDCFGTLLDTGSLSLNAVREILKNVSSGLDPAEFYAEWKKLKRSEMRIGEFRNEKELFRDTLGMMFDRYGIAADAETAVQPMIRALFSERPVFPDVLPALSGLEVSGIDTAIGSTTDTDALEFCLELNHLTFRSVFTSESLRAYKPDLRFYTSILKDTGWDAAECLFVGDNPEDDVEGPEKAGIRAVLIDRKGKYPPETARRMIRTLTELPARIETENHELSRY